MLSKIQEGIFIYKHLYSLSHKLDNKATKMQNRDLHQGFLVCFNDFLGAWIPGSPLKFRTEDGYEN